MGRRLLFEVQLGESLQRRVSTGSARGQRGVSTGLREVSASSAHNRQSARGLKCRSNKTFRLIQRSKQLGLSVG